MQGRFTDAHIALESAYAQIEGNGQENMTLCCDFLALRLSRFADIELRSTTNERYAALLRCHNSAWINIFNAACAYYYALTGETEKIPEVFRLHRLATVSTLAPGRPMIEMIENQVYLSQGAFARVIGHCQEQLAVCEGMHYALVALHLRVQAAAACEMLGRHDEARKLLAQALADAEPDGLILPFAENYRALRPLLTEGMQPKLTARIIALGEEAERRSNAGARPAALSALTEREYQIVCLIAERLSNREIAEKLFLSEGSVKQYVKQIYAKLHIEGDTRTKRGQLSALLHPNT